ncbi:hypothetical protein MCEGKSH29_00055 [Candidatus Nanopelagicaceae bacterium]
MFTKQGKDNLSWRIRFQVGKIIKGFFGNPSTKKCEGNVLSGYSEASQDLFVVRMTQSKKQGTYIEIGSGHPINSNNSYLLESEYGWRGVSVELSTGLVQEFRAVRSNPVVNSDATLLDYSTLFKEYKLPKEIDYLQIDIDPALQSLETLRGIPFQEYKFSVITFEHDRYRASRKIAKESRNILHGFGYNLVVKNLTLDTLKPFEDWWVHPDLVPKKISAKFQSAMKKPKHFDWN